VVAADYFVNAQPLKLLAAMPLFYDHPAAGNPAGLSNHLKAERFMVGQ
jgi:hypothetical protein